jgi:hypothetical protein
MRGENPGQELEVLVRLAVRVAVHLLAAARWASVGAGEEGKDKGQLAGL